MRNSGRVVRICKVRDMLAVGAKNVFQGCYGMLQIDNVPTQGRLWLLDSVNHQAIAVALTTRYLLTHTVLTLLDLEAGSK